MPSLIAVILSGELISVEYPNKTISLYLGVRVYTGFKATYWDDFEVYDTYFEAFAILVKSHTIMEFISLTNEVSFQNSDVTVWQFFYFPFCEYLIKYCWGDKV